ncbi:hypothetical protein CAPN002_21020 [Capnocytophaga stomatis]|uniref:Uncharacterized protein n=1 Tax=Capnocytophaga stomatis TaxID=1848904 RepID=A0A250FZA6_9FLAO|nr:hypothetical protein [Capnocytophaga stomatis]ATA89418.1 hypothetical protein CGC58_06570 [Capnocytophaga stomatis]GIJ94884.1 hypothetical protein CAPN002_21020 [Capnocytophaga stomatis]GIM49926.1 hypothetical protein CAPN003_13780 [Capnocytophaga stomatis]
MNSKSLFFKSLTIIHLALLTGQLLFGVVVYFLNREIWQYHFPSSNHFFWVAMALIFAVLLGHKVFYKKGLEEVRNKKSLSEKLATFQGVCIVKYGLIEAASITCIVFALLTENIYFLLISGCLLLYFITLKPTKERVINDLELNRELQEQFNKEC